MLTNIEKQEILSQFPPIKLSYENMIHKKVYNADINIAIPKGKKYFAWFTTFKERNVCVIMERTVNNQIQDIKICNVCFSNELVYGTIVYGTIFYHQQQSFFAIEDIYYFKGKKLNMMNWGEKIIILKELFNKHIKQIAYNKSFLVFGMPLLSDNLNSLKEKIAISSSSYTVDTIQFRSFHRVNNYLYINYDKFLENKQTVPNFNTNNYNTNTNNYNNNTNNRNINTNNYNNNTNNRNTNNYNRNINTNNYNTNNTNTNYKNNTNTNNSNINTNYKNNNKTKRQEIIFLVKPDIQNDIYHLYCNSSEMQYVYYDIAYIPDFVTSVMMNNLFRKIKENSNLDALEESDDEEEFETERESRFVHLDKSYKIICSYNYKFKKWYPITLAPTNSIVITQKELP